MNIHMQHDITIEKIREFQRILRKVYENGTLERGSGLCKEVGYHQENMLPIVGTSYEIIRLFMRDHWGFLGGIEKPGTFGPLRKTLAAMLLSIPPEDLLEIIEAPRVFTED